MYETIGKYSNNQVLEANEHSRPVKDTCDLYAKVRKFSSVSKGTNANLDFVSKYELSRVDSNITEDMGTSVNKSSNKPCLYEIKQQYGDQVENEDFNVPEIIEKMTEKHNPTPGKDNDASTLELTLTLDTSDPAVPGQNTDSELPGDEDETGKESILKRNCGLHGWQAADI